MYEMNVHEPPIPYGDFSAIGSVLRIPNKLREQLEVFQVLKHNQTVLSSVFRESHQMSKCDIIDAEYDPSFLSSRNAILIGVLSVNCEINNHFPATEQRFREYLRLV
jgi:hypothetical protein